MSTRRQFLIRAASASVVGSANTDSRLEVDGVDTTSLPLTKCLIPRTDLMVSRIAYGCGYFVADNKNALSALDVETATRLINTACDSGITFFDLADIYGFGKAEAAFGEILRKSPGLRNRITIQSKCGMQKEFKDVYNCSYAHIINSTDISLRRLGTDHLDILLLHVPDALVEPAEVAKAFDELKRKGKVRHFGVSNHSADQLDLLGKYVQQPLVVNQVPLGLARVQNISDGATLNYCRMHDIQLQAHSPLRGDLLSPPSDATPETKELASALSSLAVMKNATSAAVALAWILRHPAIILPVIGPTNPKHIIEDCAANTVMMSREEWYALYSLAAKMQHAA